MLPAGSRLRRRADFTSTLRRSRGVRAGGLLVVHRAAADAVDVTNDFPDALESALPPAQVGFVVSRAVGPAVIRNRVRRRLRHIASGRLAQLPAGARVVVRALPGSAEATYAQLDAALGRALEAPSRAPRTRS